MKSQWQKDKTSKERLMSELVSIVEDGGQIVKEDADMLVERISNERKNKLPTSLSPQKDLKFNSNSNENTIDLSNASPKKIKS